MSQIYKLNLNRKQNSEGKFQPLDKEEFFLTEEQLIDVLPDLLKKLDKGVWATLQKGPTLFTNSQKFKF